MRHQPFRLGTFLYFLLDRLAQLRDARVQSIQQLQQVVLSPGSPVPANDSSCSRPRSRQPLATQASFNATA
jgi:hypothetical protein